METEIRATGHGYHPDQFPMRIALHSVIKSRNRSFVEDHVLPNVIDEEVSAEQAYYFNQYLELLFDFVIPFSNVTHPIQSDHILLYKTEFVQEPYNYFGLKSIIDLLFLAPGAVEQRVSTFIHFQQLTVGRLVDILREAVEFEQDQRFMKLLVSNSVESRHRTMHIGRPKARSLTFSEHDPIRSSAHFFLN